MQSEIYDRVESYLREERNLKATSSISASVDYSSLESSAPCCQLSQERTAAQQSDDDAEGFATADPAAGDVPGVSPAVSFAAAEARLGPDVVHFLYNDCESEISWASSSGESSNSFDGPSPADSRSPEPVLPDDDPENTADKVFKMIKFLASIYFKWPPDDTAKIGHANLSRKEYKAIVQALKQVALVEELRGLPYYADTLRHRFLGSLPLLAMRRTTLTLDKK
ncbi:hypothetical protein E4U40_002447 [Claviceps sp. LM458 group G5]|nr:hypothetical protein E4U40_002447 [Claviceps sp. LM458 group G5]